MVAKYYMLDPSLGFVLVALNYELDIYICNQCVLNAKTPAVDL